jgi:hypothetical protein
MKKSWTRPELTILVRASDDERVLSGCKNADNTGFGTTVNGCVNVQAICAGACSSLNGS